MGSSCSSVRKKDRHKSRRSSSVDSGPHVDICGQRRCSERSIESLPYGPKSSPPSTSKSSQQQEVSATSRSDGDAKNADTKQTVLSPNHGTKELLGVTSTSPLPASQTPSPFTTPLTSKQGSGIPDLSLFTSDVRSLLLGHKPDETYRLPFERKLTLFICCNPKDEIMSQVEAALSDVQNHCISKGYELMIVNMHLESDSYAFDDHSYSKLCLETLKSLNESLTVLNLVILGSDNGFDLPSEIEETDFKQIVSIISDKNVKELFSKWYTFDENSIPAQYVLRRVSKCLPSFHSKDSKERGDAISCWQNECLKMCNALNSNVDTTIKAKYLTSLLEKEVSFIAGDLSVCKRSFSIHRGSNANGKSDDAFQELIVNFEKQLPETQRFILPTNSTESVLEAIEGLKSNLKKVIENMVEEESQEESLILYSGIESSLHYELIQQERVRSHLACNFVGRDSLLKSIESYITSPSNLPLVVYGPRGCGKSALMAKISFDACLHFTSLAVIYRSVGVSEESMTQEQILRSICEHCCVLYGEHQSVGSMLIDTNKTLDRVLKRVSDNRPLLILIDGIDQLAPFSDFDVTWLSKELPNTKVIVTLTEGSLILSDLKTNLTEENLIEITSLSASEGYSIFEQTLNGCNRKISNAQKEVVTTCLQTFPLPFYAHLLAVGALDWHSEDIISESDVGKNPTALICDMLLEVEKCLGDLVANSLFSLLTVSKHGLTDSQLLCLLSCEEVLKNSLFRKDNKFPDFCWFWTKQRLNCLLRTKLVGRKSVNCWKCGVSKHVASQRLSDELQLLSRKRIIEHFKNSSPILQFNEIDKLSNRIATEELPFAAISVHKMSAAKDYVFDVNWMQYKLKTSDPLHFLEDIEVCEKLCEQDSDDLKLLKDVVKVSAYPLRYDGSQIFSQIYGRLKCLMSESGGDAAAKYPLMKKLFDACCKPSSASLFPLNTHFMSLVYDEQHFPDILVQEDSGETFCFLSVIKADPSHVVALSSDDGKIVVWNIFEERPVRILKGISQPRNVKMVDKHRALVLCNRELKLYDLNSGALKSKLKGVMNQKMPFYGLHDDKYVVALSRNRMYVNMMNIATGDLETQFKVGEDRFLNSLLVSCNGNICVCGDETQKPFPLLVWDLSSRKLLYDLRIPHHEFITNLAAISDDGHYVVSVCKELSSSAPNFIIVYDLQSGTLFKKWKPDCNTNSIAISSQGGFVMNGLENCRLLIWDLSTGAKRHNLIGHSAPVDTLQVDEFGKSFLSFDSTGKDRSIRIWNPESGTCLAVFTPDYPLSCCQLSSNGKLVVFCFEKCAKLQTLLLCHENSAENEKLTEFPSFGESEYDGLEFDLSDASIA